jgi:ParB-like chromosome segregation protein Spo0J
MAVTYPSATPEADTSEVDRSSESVSGWLEARGVTATFVNSMDLSQINRELSLRNQARLATPLSEETVDGYAQAMENGDQFPPIVVYQRGAGKYVVIDGNHRVEAAHRTDTPLGAYVVEKPTDEQIAVLTYEANARSGLPVSVEDKIQQAVHLVELGASRPEAARLLGIKVSRVEYAMSAARADKRLQDLGVDLSKMSESTRRRLGFISNDNVLKEAATAVIDHSLRLIDLDDIIPLINSERTEATQIAAITNWVKDRETMKKNLSAGGIAFRSGQRGAPGRIRPVQRMQNVINRIKAFDFDLMPLQAMSEDAKARLRNDLIASAQHISTWLDKLHQAEK